MSKRTFLGKPLDAVAKRHHPYKCDLDDFIKAIRTDLGIFARNMRETGQDGDYMNDEQWMEKFLAWEEFNTE